MSLALWPPQSSISQRHSAPTSGGLAMAQLNASAQQGSIASEDSFLSPVPQEYPLDIQSNALEVAVIAFTVYVIFFRSVEKLVAFKPSLLPTDVSAERKYETIYHFTKGTLWIFAMLCSLPSISSLVRFLSSDGHTIMVPSPLTGRLLQIASGLSIAPIMVDLAARRHIQWPSYLHHVLTCAFTVVCVGWKDAASVAVFYCTTCYFAVPLEFAFGVCAMQARVQTCIWWLTFAKWASSFVFALGQVGIVTSMYKIFQFYAAKPDADTTTVTVCFALGLLLDVMLNSTQWFGVSILHGMAQRRKAQLKSKSV